MTGFAPEIIWGIFPRLLGIVYFVAIGSLYGQVLPFAGTNGLRPIRKHLDKIREDYPSWRRFVYFPTLFWLNDSDAFLRLVVAIGTAAGLLALIGGAITSISLFVCWACFLSLDMAFSLAYPWDSLLMEAGFLAIFLPPVQFLPQIESRALPLPMVLFAYNFLIFRLMFGFGKFKFLGTNRKERLYLKPFLINQPMPSPLGWLASHLPGWAAMMALGYLFLVEMILPFLIFLGGDFRLIAASGITGLMLGIQLMGNFGFFNLLVICLCVTLLDTQASLLGQIQGVLATLPQSPVVSAVLFVWAVGALIYLPFNSWCTQAWVYWPSIVFAKPLWLRRVIAFYRGFAPFRFINSYGVFPPTSSPPVRWTVLFEGSNDGQAWQAYAYRFMPTGTDAPPRFIAPYHPRLDHAIFYEAFGTSQDNFVESLFSTGDPYNFDRVSIVDSFVQGLLEGNPLIIRLFGRNPFADAAPKFIRVNCYTLAPTSIAEWRQTGTWWRKEWVGLHTPVRSLADYTVSHDYVDPERFHWDEILWKRRAPRIATLMAGDLAALEAASDLIPADVNIFWNDFIPSLAQLDPSDWNVLPQFIMVSRRRYTSAQWSMFETLFARLSLLLYARLEPHVLGEAKPSLEMESFFHIGLLTYRAIVCGRDTFETILGDPTGVLPLAQSLTTQTGLFYAAVFWLDKLVFQARKFRLVGQFNTLNYARGLPGFAEAIPFLRDQFYSADEEKMPAFARKVQDGEWLIVDTRS